MGGTQGLSLQRSTEEHRRGQKQLFDRVAPNDISAEACVLGSIILDLHALDDVQQVLTPEDFLRPAHNTIYKHCQILAAGEGRIDLVLLRDSLGKALQAVGGVEYLVSLAEGVPNAANIEYYAAIVKEKSLRRGMILAAGNMLRNAYDNDDFQAVELLDHAQQALLDLQGGSTADRLTSIGEAMEHLLGHVGDVEAGRERPGIPTGFQHIDNLTLGLRPGTVMLFASYPGGGKSVFLKDVARNVALEPDSPGVVFFSGEMGADEIAQRTLAGITRHESIDIARGRGLTPEWWTEAAGVAHEAQKWRWAVYDVACTTATMVSIVRRLMHKWGSRPVVIVDYLQKMHGVGKSPTERVSQISGALKDMSRSLLVPVLVAAQFNRSARNAGRAPEMGDLRQSGEIEQDVDIGLIGYAGVESDGDWQQVQVKLGKGRGGRTTSWDSAVQLALHRPTTTFYEGKVAEVVSRWVRGVR